jgi:hypothetical protein
MAFMFAYTLNGDGAGVLKDYPLDTTANYKTGAGTNDLKKGDLVFLSSGLLRRATAATATGLGIGVIEGGEFTGLAGAPYTAVNASQTAQVINTSKNPNGVGKVRSDKTASVYKIPVNSGVATNANIGLSYQIILDAAGDQKADLTLTTIPVVKVMDYTPDGKFVFVTLV